MIHERRHFNARCDSCKDYFASEDVEFYCYDSIEELEEALEGADWEIKNGKIICLECKLKQNKKVVPKNE